VPVEENYVAPDGATYILTGDQSRGNPDRFYLVDAKTGARRLLPTASGPPQAPNSWQVVRYTTDGVYLWSVGGHAVSGLWLMNPHTGKVRLVNASHYWNMVDGGVAWALEPPFSKKTTHPYRIYRLDLATLKVSLVYQAKAARIDLRSPTPEGDLLLRYDNHTGNERLALLTASGRLSFLDLPPDHGTAFQVTRANPGVWVNFLHGGLALYVKGEGVHLVRDSDVTTVVAGGCW
jgi:hypothetical protein